MFVEIVGADQQDHRSWLQRQHVFLQADQDAARRIAADAAVGNLDTGKSCRQRIAPELRDRVAQEDDSALILLMRLCPFGSPLAPQLLEPVVAADGSGSGQPFICRGDGERVGARRRYLRPRLGWPPERDTECEEEYCEVAG